MLPRRVPVSKVLVTLNIRLILHLVNFTSSSPQNMALAPKFAGQAFIASSTHKAVNTLELCNDFNFPQFDREQC